VQHRDNRRPRCRLADSKPTPPQQKQRHRLTESGVAIRFRQGFLMKYFVFRSPHAARDPRQRDRIAAWRWCAIALAAVTLACTAATAAAPAPAGDATLGADLAGLLAFARQQSPELAAAQQDAQAAEQRIAPAAALSDPVLRVELMDLNRSAARLNPLPTGYGETRFTLMQNLPAWGKRDLKRDIAEADFRQAQSRNEAAWVELAARIKAGYAEYFRAVGNQRLTAEVLALSSRLEQIAQARYAGGLVAQQDPIRAQIEQTALRSELIALEADKAQGRSRLNALLGRDAAAPLAEPEALRPLPTGWADSAAALADRVRAHNPALQAEQARLAMAQKSRELTQRNRLPDFQVGVSPTLSGSRITAVGVMLEFNLPLQRSSRDAQEREAQSLVDSARSRFDALALQLQGELAGQIAAFDAARQTEVLVRTQLLPQSDLSLQSALAAYEAGKVDFVTLLDAQRQIRGARSSLLKARVDAQLRLAEIERILGEDL
jgi:outer membrane protein TolC